MDALGRLERYARRLATGGCDVARDGSLERAALRLAGGRFTRRQAFGVAAAGAG